MDSEDQKFLFDCPNSLTETYFDVKMVLKKKEKKIYFILKDLDPESELNYYYEATLSMNNFIQMNRFFSKFKSEIEIFSFIKGIINNENECFVTRNEDGVSADLKIAFENQNKDELISIKGQKIPYQSEQKIAKINELQQKISDMKFLNIEYQRETEENNKEIASLSEDNKEKSEKIQKLEQEIRKKDHEIQLIIDDKKKKSKTIPNSSGFTNEILIYEEENSLLEKWIDNFQYMKPVLLYQASRDGDKAEAFHRLCDNRSPTLTLILTDNGDRFGGYTQAKWVSSKNWTYKNDNNTFLFNLDNKTKYNNVINHFAICNNRNYGPTFLGNDLCISDKFFSEWSIANPMCTFGNIEIGEMKRGYKKFKIAELEVYLIVKNNELNDMSDFH